MPARTLGYVRGPRARTRLLDGIWAYIRGAREPFALADLADHTGASRSYAKHVLRAAKRAGYVIARGSTVLIHTDVNGGARATLYIGTQDMPETRPVLAGIGGDQILRVEGS
jgi:hypothetical protein